MKRQFNMMSNIPKALQEFLSYVNAGKNMMTVADVRKAMDAMARMFSLPKLKLPVVEDSFVSAEEHEIPVRIYHPNPKETLPLIIYTHGGGHMCGGLDSHDASCRRIAKACHCALLAVDYRLTPDFPYPAGLEDCIAVFQSRAELLQDFKIDTNQVILAGDSAGANLAISVCHKMKWQGDASIHGLVLIYPSTDFNIRHDSIDRYGKGFMITKEKIAWYFDHYLPNIQDRTKASPLHFDHLNLLPATYIAVAEFDPLHDEGVEFAARLESLKVPVTLQEFPGMIHAFMQLERVVPNQVSQLMASIGTFVRRNVNKSSVTSST